MKRRLLSLAIILIGFNVSGCAFWPKYLETPEGSKYHLCTDLPIFYVLKNVNPVNVNAVIDAADYWNVVLGRHVFDYRGVDNSAIPRYDLLVIEETNLKDACGQAYHNPWSNGCPTSLNVKLDYFCAKSPGLTETLVRHELGHILGLADSDNPFHLMNGDIHSHDQHPWDARSDEIEKLKEFY